jgi:hypothetical protein
MIVALPALEYFCEDFVYYRCKTDHDIKSIQEDWYLSDEEHRPLSTIIMTCPYKARLASDILKKLRVSFSTS